MEWKSVSSNGPSSVMPPVPEDCASGAAQTLNDQVRHLNLTLTAGALELLTTSNEFCFLNSPYDANVDQDETHTIVVR